MGNNLDQSIKITNEDKLLILCSRTQLNPEIKAKLIKLLEKGLDWDYLTQRAFQHKITPLLYRNLKNLSEYVPEDRLNNLMEHFKMNALNNLLLLGELIKILKLLKSNGIDAIPYKGPVLAFLAYNNLSFREFGDIDLLINQSDAIMAKNIMVSKGYELFSPIDINDTYYMKFEPEYQFLNRNTGTIIEIKWKIEGNFFSFPNDLDVLSNNLEELNLNGFEVDTFSFVNHLLILCIHAAKHDWKRLSWICDISELLKSQKEINWPEILDKSEKLDIKRILLINLILARDLFKLELPDNILTSINSDSSVLNISNQIKERIFKNKSINIFQKFFSDLKKRDNLINGFRDVINDLTRPTYVDFLDIALPESLFFLYFLIRPFLLLKRYGLDSI
jgi:hypothetical protein